MLAVVEYASTGVIGTFQVVVAAFVLYALVYGRQDFGRLDAYIKRKVMSLKDQAPSPAATSSSGSVASKGLEHARKERRGWYQHLVVFAIGQTLLFVLGESWLTVTLGGETPADPSGLMSFGRIWAIVFIVDTVWSLSYTFFPRNGVRE